MMVINSTTINKRKDTPHFKSLNTIKTTMYGVEYQDPGLGQAYICGRVKPINGIQTSPFDKWSLQRQSIKDIISIFT
jgi:hypothetical protein